MGERVTLTPPTFITGRDELALPGSHIKNKIVCMHVRVDVYVWFLLVCVCRKMKAVNWAFIIIPNV